MFAICGAWADEWGVGRRVGCGQMSGAWGDDDGGVGRRVVRRDPDSGCQGAWRRDLTTNLEPTGTFLGFLGL